MGVLQFALQQPGVVIELGQQAAGFLWDGVLRGKAAAERAYVAQGSDQLGMHQPIRGVETIGVARLGEGGKDGAGALAECFGVILDAGDGQG